MMSSRPVVSILINNHNYGCYLPDAIDSALQQTYPDVEVIVVDDKSEDHSLKVLERYGNQIKVLALDKNVGQSGAMNAGYIHCTGEIVFFLDADDKLVSDVVARVVDVMVSQKCVKVHYPLLAINADGTYRSPQQWVPQPVLPSGDVTIGPLSQERLWPPNSGNAYLRLSLEKIMPIPEVPFRIAADLWLNVLSPYTGSIGTIDSFGGYYRIHNHNHSNYNKTVSIDDQEQLALRVMSRAQAIECWANRFLEPGRRRRLITPWPESVKLLVLLRAIKSSGPAVSQIGPFKLLLLGVWASHESKFRFNLRATLWFGIWFILLSLVPNSKFTKRLSKSCLTQPGTFKTHVLNALIGGEA